MNHLLHMYILLKHHYHPSITASNHIAKLRMFFSSAISQTNLNHNCITNKSNYNSSNITHTTDEWSCIYTWFTCSHKNNIACRFEKLIILFNVLWLHNGQNFALCEKHFRDTKSFRHFYFFSFLFLLSIF